MSHVKQLAYMCAFMGVGSMMPVYAGVIVSQQWDVDTEVRGTFSLAHGPIDVTDLHTIDSFSPNGYWFVHVEIGEVAGSRPVGDFASWTADSLQVNGFMLHTVAPHPELGEVDVGLPLNFSFSVDPRSVNVIRTFRDDDLKRHLASEQHVDVMNATLTVQSDFPLNIFPEPLDIVTYNLNVSAVHACAIRLQDVSVQQQEECIVVTIPEPHTFMLLVSGLLALMTGLCYRRWQG